MQPILKVYSRAEIDALIAQIDIAINTVSVENGGSMYAAKLEKFDRNLYTMAGFQTIAKLQEAKSWLQIMKQVVDSGTVAGGETLGDQQDQNKA